MGIGSNEGSVKEFLNFYVFWGVTEANEGGRLFHIRVRMVHGHKIRKLTGSLFYNALFFFRETLDATPDIA